MKFEKYPELINGICDSYIKKVFINNSLPYINTRNEIQTLKQNLENNESEI